MLCKWTPRRGDGLSIPSRVESGCACRMRANLGSHEDEMDRGRGPSYRRKQMQELFEAVRAKCPSGLWSKGVELVRHFAVTRQSAEAGQITCRVRRSDRAIAATVQLYPEDAEWDCDCGSRTPCCEHVAAAVIALKKADAEGKSLPEAMSSAANLGYRLVRFQGELKCERFIVTSDGTKVPLRTTLASAVANPASGFDLTPTQEDLALERLIAASGLIRPEQVLSVLKMLEGHANVEFEGRPVQVQTEPRRPRAVLSEVDGGFLLEQSPDPEILEIVGSYVGVTATQLVALAATEYSGPKYEKLVPRRIYGPDEVSALVTEVLPELKRWFSLELRTERLPEVTSDERPRVVLEVEQEGDRLSVLPLLVYGDPAMARIDRNRLVHLKGPIPMRKLDLERRAMENLRQGLGLVTGNRASFSGKEALQLAAKLDHWHGEITGAKSEGFIRDVTLQLRFDAVDRLPRFVSVDQDEELSASAEAVVKAYRAGLNSVPLLDGGFARIPTDFVARHVYLLERLLAARADDDPQRLAPHALPALLELREAVGAALPPSLAALKELMANPEAVEGGPLPDDLTVTPRAYQLQGIHWLERMRQAGLGAILADDMGLGKTLQALCAVSGRSLVVCPTTLLANWQSEIQRFRPRLSVAVYQGKDRQLEAKADITLVSYALLRRDIDTFTGVRWGTVVLDEAHTIKNPESQVAQAAYALCAEFRISLSGTPIENRLEELYSQLHFTNRDLLGSREQFQSSYVEPIAAGDPEAEVRLRRIIAPFILRRTKDSVLPELPPRFEHDLYVQLSEEEQALYADLLTLARREILPELEQGGNVLHALEMLLRLRQAACHAGLVPGQHAETSSKLELLLEKLELIRAEGQKTLVFSQWTSLLDRIEQRLTEAHIDSLRLDGSTVDRAAVVDRFQSDEGPGVLLLSLKAGGTGLNLTAAEHVFLMDLWWNPAVERQAMDRAHRIGQKKAVFVHRLVAKDTVEEKIRLLHAKKRDLADRVLEDSELLASLGRQELLELLS